MLRNIAFYISRSAVEKVCSGQACQPNQKAMSANKTRTPIIMPGRVEQLSSEPTLMSCMSAAMRAVLIL